eukprot:jgi/Hompol1/5766/HPOL_001399-RA
MLEFYTPPAFDSEVIVMIINLVILFGLLLTVGILAVWQISYVASNVTTIESLEKAKVEELMDKGKIPDHYVYPYDLGFFKNMQMVFGKRWWLWWLPQPAPGDGIHFEINAEALAQRSAWPPREYHLYRKYPYGKPPKNSRSTIDVDAARSHVRRGSEGYLVQLLTEEDRERQVVDAERTAAQAYPTQDRCREHRHDLVDESSTDFDSLEDDDDEEELDLDGVARLAPNVTPRSIEADSDDEPLYYKQSKLQSLK